MEAASPRDRGVPYYEVVRGGRNLRWHLEYHLRTRALNLSCTYPQHPGGTPRHEHAGPPKSGSRELVVDVLTQTLIVVAPLQLQPPRQPVLIHGLRNLPSATPPDSDEGSQEEGSEEEV